MRIRGFISALLLVPMLAYGQPGGLNNNRPRSSYDPAAAGRPQAAQDGGISSALQKINPGDKDYGAVVQQAQIAAVEQTVEDFYWRSCMVLTVLLILTVMYIAWLWREREIRLRISGDIVSQLYNSYVTSRAKAMEMIEQHNKLARRYNAKVEEIATAKAEAEQKEKEQENKASRKDEKKIVQDLQGGEEGIAEQPTAAVPVPNNGESFIPESENTADWTVVVKTLKAQIIAKDQKITNLRAQINRAHSSLAEEREAKVSGDARNGRQS